MTNALDDHFSLMNNAAAGVKMHTAQNGVTADGLKAQGDTLTQQQASQLLEKQMQELMQNDPASTLGQPGRGGDIRYVVRGAPRNVIVMPRINNGAKACYEDSPWTQHLRPAPMQELDVSQYVRQKQTLVNVQPKELKYPPEVPNFPIKFDRILGYREFLS